MTLVNLHGEFAEIVTAEDVISETFLNPCAPTRNQIRRHTVLRMPRRQFSTSVAVVTARSAFLAEAEQFDAEQLSNEQGLQRQG